MCILYKQNCWSPSPPQMQNALWNHLRWKKKMFKGKTNFSSVTKTWHHILQTKYFKRVQLKTFRDPSAGCAEFWSGPLVWLILVWVLYCGLYITLRFTHTISSYSVAVQVKELQNRNRKRSCNSLNTLCGWQVQATVILFVTLYFLFTGFHINIYTGGF